MEQTKNYPKVYLAIDNCFAIKRWVSPSAWMSAVKEIGGSYVEASTDNECDPLFSPTDYLDDWANEVLAEGEKQGVRIANFYTGYQTYRTVGLAHRDPRVRQKLLDGWLKPAVRLARKVGAAGVGFSFFAMPDEVLQSPAAYAKSEEHILRALTELVAYSQAQRPVAISFEQMYAPHQPPWTIEGSEDFLRRLYARTHSPAYVTIDVGHQVGQKRFLKPTPERVAELLKKGRQGEKLENVWLGPAAAYKLYYDAIQSPASQDAASVVRILKEMDPCPYLFARESDGDTYAWLERLGAYSPIIHMQQNNGVTSHHAPFTAANNKTGIIEGKKLLAALARSYERPVETGMPPRTGDIYLSFEIFASNIDYNHDTIARMTETLGYWRQFVPRDGIPLNELV
jgi:sugar phosphate isomerase/epimerase